MKGSWTNEMLPCGVTYGPYLSCGLYLINYFLTKKVHHLISSYEKLFNFAFSFSYKKEKEKEKTSSDESQKR